MPPVSAPICEREGCGKSCKTGRRFCSHKCYRDHTRIIHRCEKCGAHVDRRSVVCANCHAEITTATRPESPPAPSVSTPTPNLPISVDEAWQWWDGFVGRTQARHTAPERRTGPTTRFVVCSDLHAPFHDPIAVAELVVRERDRTDVLIIAGDLMDSYSLSRFMKYEKVDIQQELAATDALMEQLASAFPEVWIEEGNHDKARFEKGIRDRLSQDQVQYIEHLTGGNLSAIAVFAKKYPNVKLINHEVGRFTMGWLAQVGDVLIAHRERFSKVPGSALRGADEWLDDMHESLDLKPWRIVLHAHTHQLCFFPFRSRRLLVEIGCLCATHAYHLEAKTGGRPQRLGYVTFQQSNGVTDIESVRLHWLDEAVRRQRGVA